MLPGSGECVDAALDNLGVAFQWSTWRFASGAYSADWVAGREMADEMACVIRNDVARSKVGERN